MPAFARMLRSGGFRYAAAIWVSLFTWWLALLPGGMSDDSILVWRQIKTGEWTSHHPPPYVAYVWLTSLGGHSPAASTLIQTVIVTIAVAWLVHVLTQVLAGGMWVWRTALALSVLPLLGPFAVMIWKDVPETAALLGVTGLLVRAWHRNESPTRAWWGWLAGCGLAAALLRWNGVATLVVAALVLLAAPTWRRRWAVPVVLAGSGLAGIGMLFLIPVVSSVTPPQPIDTQMEKLADLAQLARNTPGAFSLADRAVLGRVAPFREWARAGYNCYTVDVVTYDLIIFSGRLPRYEANAAAITRVWHHVAPSRPAELLHARLCRASLAWSLADPSGRVILTTWPAVNRNPFGLHEQGPAALRHVARRAIRWGQSRWWQELLWRPLPWLIICAALLVLAARRAGPGITAGVVAVPVGVLVSYAIAPAAQDARYGYPAVLVCQLATVAALVSMRRGSSRGAVNEQP